MKNKTFHILNTGILAVCLYFYTDVLDYTLAPRFLLFSILIWTLLVFAFRKLRDIEIYISVPEIGLLLFSFYAVLSIFWALNPALSIVESSKLLLYSIFLIIITQILYQNELKPLDVLLKYLIVLFYISLLFFAHQLSNIDNYNRLSLYLISGINGHKNLFSTFIYLSSIFSLLGISLLNKKWKIISSLALIIQISIVLFLQTRSVWIGYLIFILSIITIFILRRFVKRINLKHVIVMTVATLISLNFLLINILPNALHRYQLHLPKELNIQKTYDQSTLIERVLVWQKTYEISKNHKFFGIGANNWQIYFPSSSLPDIYPVQSQNITFQRPHNDFLWILSEYGFFGFNLYFLSILTICFFLFRQIINDKSYPSMIVLSGIIGYFCISFFDFPRERVELNILIMILLGIAIYLIHKENHSIYKIKLRIKPIYSIAILLPFTFVILLAFLNIKGEYYTKKMQVEWLKNNRNRVIEYSNTAISFCYNIDPTTMPLLWYSGNAHASNNNIIEAYKDFQKSYVHHPYNYLVLNDLGSIYFQMNNLDSAIYFYQKSIAINYRYDEPKLNLIVLYINTGNYQKAHEIEKTLFSDSQRRTLYKNMINQAMNIVE